jgi:hypothetical protein
MGVRRLRLLPMRRMVTVRFMCELVRDASAADAAMVAADFAFVEF